MKPKFILWFHGSLCLQALKSISMKYARNKSTAGDGVLIRGAQTHQGSLCGFSMGGTYFSFRVEKQMLYRSRRSEDLLFTRPLCNIS